MGANVVLIDNYDSFVYNLVQYFGELGASPSVFRNDEISIADLRELNADAIIISPGPGAPKDSGISNSVIETLGGELPILGVCLGHQCIGEVFGGEIVRAPVPMHGKTSQVTHNDSGVLKGLPNPFQATRYHSLAVEESTFPETLEITARSEDGVIMGLRHKELKIEGVQFHPESILTNEGRTILGNFLDLIPARVS